MSNLAIITGATRGIGFELTKRLLNDGISVLALGRQLENIQGLQDKFDTALRTVRADLGTLDGIHAAGVDLKNQIQGEEIKYLINCAGIITPIGPVTTIDLADFSRLMNINLFASFHLINILMPQFVQGGRVLNVSSRAAQLNVPGLSIYCISKAALESLTGSYQSELASVSVSTCIPGEVDTDLQSDLRNGPQSLSNDVDSSLRFFDRQWFLENKKRLIPAATAAKFLHWLLTGPDNEEFEAKRPWTIYDQEVHPRWLEKGEVFAYESP